MAEEYNLQYRYDVPGQVISDVPVNETLRSEGFTELRRISYKANVAQAVGAAETLGFVWSVPPGEIWVPDRIALSAEASASVQWALGLFMHEEFQINEDDKWTTEGQQWQSILGNTFFAGATATPLALWSRTNTDFYYSKLEERLKFTTRISPVSPVTINWVQTSIRYYRVPLWDALLDELKEKYPEEDLTHVLLAAALSKYVNQRNSSYW